MFLTLEMTSSAHFPIQTYTHSRHADVQKLYRGPSEYAQLVLNSHKAANTLLVGNNEIFYLKYNQFNSLW